MICKNIQYIALKFDEEPENISTQIIGVNYILNFLFHFYLGIVIEK